MGGDCALQISVHHFLGEIFDRIQLVPFLEIEMCSFRTQNISAEYLDAIKMRDKYEIYIRNIWM